MAAKKPAKRHPMPSKPPSKAKALQAGRGHIRTREARPPPIPNGLFSVDTLGHAMMAYAELPSRLLACRSPAEFWGEYLRFGQRLFGGFQSNTPSQSAQKVRGKRRRPKTKK
jgi:hypothetical protein